jgi:hypothetical protein
MNKIEIEAKAKWLRRQVYDRRREFWPDREAHPLEMLDPEIAALALGVAFRYEQEISFRMPGVQSEIGGLLYRPGKTILVATRFGLEKARFTAAHEIGHWVLHPSDRPLHRDIPIEGIERDVQDPIEREADYFAAVFLMPDHFLKRLFQIMFLCEAPFVFDETTAFHLRPYDTPALLYPDQGSMIRERTLASAKSFNGHHYEKSLAEMFHVSVGTMAIRIKELRLVRDWP